MFFVTFLAGNIATNGLAFYWDSVDVWHLQFVKVLNMLVRFVVGTLGSIAIIVAVRFLCLRFRFVGLFSIFGEETLGIYFLQGAMISWIGNRFVKLDAGVLTVFLSSCGIFALCFLMVRVLKMSDFVKKGIFGK